MTPETKNSTSRSIPGYLWLGLAIIILAEAGLLTGIAWIATWLTPIMWTGYILFADGLLYRQNGSSWLTTRKLEFPFLAIISIGIWLVFEVYNFHLQNWLYAGVPGNIWLRNFAYAWSFATIIPGVFLTAELVEVVIPRGRHWKGLRVLASLPDWTYSIVGLVMISLPLALPISLARYLFGSVWIGFILLMDPLNRKIGAASLKPDLMKGTYRKILALLIGGLICGFLWEAWNYQAFLRQGGHWVYTIPDELRILDLHYGQMPILGMLGFPPFALELYLLYHFIRSWLEIDRFLGPLDF
jgi:hypothetical protein